MINYHSDYGLQNFAEVPSNVTIELGTPPPPLRCRHTSSEAIITWRVNGLPLRQFPKISSGFVNENGHIVYTLTIPAEPQYNGTVVECVAIFTDGSPTEVTPAATIMFTFITAHLPTILNGSYTQYLNVLTIL